MADAHGSGPCVGNNMRVQVPSSALNKKRVSTLCRPFSYLVWKRLLFTPCGVSSTEDLPMKVAFGKGANPLSTVLHILTLSAASAQSCLNCNG